MIFEDCKYCVLGILNLYLELGDVVLVDVFINGLLEVFLVDSVFILLGLSGLWDVVLNFVE